MDTRNYRRIAIIALIAILCFVIGALIGYFSMQKEHLKHCQEEHKVYITPEKFAKLNRVPDQTISKKILDLISTERLDETLRFLTQKTRYAGTKNQEELATFVHTTFLRHGLGSERVNYNVLLSYPKVDANSTVLLLDNKDKVLHQVSTYEEAVEGEDPNQGGVLRDFKAFNSLSPSGVVEGDLVYAGYGRKDDFEKLEEAGIDVRKKIAIIKYGKIFRGNKVQFAAEAGAVGVILYSDPSDYGACCDDVKPYPHSIYLPMTGMQRGNVVTRKGDQTTPGYPSTVYSYRLNDEELKTMLPPIPSQPIPAKDAYRLLRELEGEELNQDSTGRFNISFPHDGGLKPGLKVKLVVENDYEMRPIINVVGKIKGNIEPDRYVIIGGHRDAYVFGSADPMSGTTVLVEIARVLGLMVRQGWQPRRSILVCSWDAEEYGLVGSYEWVEENIKWVREKVVAYLNVDTTVAGNRSIYFKSAPLLKKIFIESSKLSPDPKGKFKSLYDMWYAAENGNIRARPLGGGSDFVPFMAVAGVSSMYQKFYGIESEDERQKWTSTSTPLYHSRYETYRHARMIDPEAKFTKSMTSVLAEVIRSLADSVILPFDLKEFMRELGQSVEAVEKILSDRNSTIDRKYGEGIKKGVEAVEEAVAMFESHLASLDTENPLVVREANDKLMDLERVFLDDNGLPDRPHFKHLLRSPSSVDYYGGSSFPGIMSLHAKYNKDKSEKNKRQLEKHLSVIIHTLFSISKVLQVD